MKHAKTAARWRMNGRLINLTFYGSKFFFYGRRRKMRHLFLVALTHIFVWWETRRIRNATVCTVGFTYLINRIYYYSHCVTFLPTSCLGDFNLGLVLSLTASHTRFDTTFAVFQAHTVIAKVSTTYWSSISQAFMCHAQIVQIQSCNRAALFVKKKHSRRCIFITSYFLSYNRCSHL